MNKGTNTNRRRISRRSFLKRGLFAAGALPVLGLGLRGLGIQAMGGTTNKFLQIFLNGGWDSHLATDPVVAGSGKQLSSGVDAAYDDYSTHTVSGSQVIGDGLQPALAALQGVPTVFINGMYVEVTAHELARNYVLSGRLSLSRSRVHPAFVALMGEQSEEFPAHVILGNNIPVGDTKDTAPPLVATDFNGLVNMLAGPYHPDYSDVPQQVISSAHNMIAQLNSNFYAKINNTAHDSLAAWRTADRSLDDFYAKRYYESIELTDQMIADYDLDQGYDRNSLYPLAVNVLASGLSSLVTLDIGDYDTHSNHFADHLPQMQGFAGRLAQMITDMQNTPDPDDPSQSLMDTTTILVTSEFVRTPLLNDAAGTDHWQSASAIVLGNGVRSDRVTVGATDDNAYPRGWNGETAVDFSPDTQLLPDDLAAAILRQFGASEAADAITTNDIRSQIFS